MNKKEIPVWAKQGCLVWQEIRDKTEEEVLEYNEAIITESDYTNNILKVSVKGGESIVMRPDRIWQRLETPGLINDLSDIPILNDAELLKHCEFRYNKDFIQVFCGPTLIVINPFKRVEHEESLETKNIIMSHLKNQTLNKCIPHLWTISARCYQFLFELEKNQAICISGESGAGKTESSKRCMAFLTSIHGARKSVGFVPIEDKILNCNPLLEAFGNAKTFRNDNSSRFGKYTALYLDKSTKKVMGATIDKYLLEKSRVTVTAKGERNYHIFYALCRFAPKEKLKKLHLLNNDGICDMTKLRFLNQSGVYTVDKVDDEEFYNDVLNSLDSLDFTKDEQECIWKAIAVTLHFGNVEIDQSNYEEGATACSIKKNDAWKAVCDLLQINEELFEEALTHKELKVGKMVTKSPLSPNFVNNNIESMAKELYDRMFNWIIIKLNLTLIPECGLSGLDQYGKIGLLDIFGFEIFDVNSLEQFFINYANERLQGLYIEYIFKNECKIFEEEGLAEYTQLIKFEDNKPVCNAMDGRIPPGVFILIDQTCAQNNTDDDLHGLIKKTHKSTQSITFPRISKFKSFIVVHTARSVEYNTDNFVEKNKDSLPANLKSAFSSSYETIYKIFDNTQGLDDIPEIDPNKRVNPKEKYLGFKFRREMNKLIEELSSCYCHFIRCIKPNEKKKANCWDAHLALMQIRYMGLLDSLKVRKESYPFRFYFKDFFKEYQDLDMGENGAKNYKTLVAQNVNFKSLSKNLLANCEITHTEKDVLWGKGRVFLNEKFKIDLDKALREKQVKKTIALETLGNLYKQYILRQKVTNFIETESKSIIISRGLLKTWAAKIEGMKFKKYLKIVRRIQFKHRYTVQKRQKRFKLFNMKMLCKYLSLHKISRKVNDILTFNRRVLVLQAMLNRKILDSKNRYCREIVQQLFNASWNKISFEITEKSVGQVQRNFRSYLLRKRKCGEFQILTQKIEQRKIFTSSSAIQRFIRGELVRARMERLNRAAQVVQGYFRMKWMRGYFLRLVRAILVIQKFFKKMYIRRQQMRDGMTDFMDKNGSYNKNVALIEHKILFGDEEQIANIQNMSDYTQMPFYRNGGINFKCANFRNFIPKQPEIELKPKAKFFNLLVDVTVQSDTTCVYKKTWAKEFTDCLSKMHSKKSRLLSIELGDSFSMAVTSDRDIYTWGLNDYNQCAKANKAFSLSASKVKNLSSNNCKMVSCGQDHGIMVDDANNIYSWGRNTEGQLGLGHTKKNENISILNTLKGTVQNVKCKDHYSYILMKTGKVYHWPSIDKDEKIFKPKLLTLPKGIIIDFLDLGSDFGMLKDTNGLVYSFGENKYGELGLSDYKHRETPTLISIFKSRNDKVIEISCGFKHVICRTSLNKIFVWGCNSQYQLGLGDRKSRCKPAKLSIPVYKKFRTKPLSVQANQSGCFILLDNRSLFFTGKQGNEKVASEAKKFNYEAQISEVVRFPKRFVINLSKKQTKVGIRQVSIVSQKVLPPLEAKNNDLLSKNIEQKYMLRDNKKSSINFSFSNADSERMYSQRMNPDNVYIEQGIEEEMQMEGELIVIERKNSANEIFREQVVQKSTVGGGSRFKKTVSKANNVKNEASKHYKKLLRKDPKKLTFEEKKFIRTYKKLRKQ